MGITCSLYKKKKFGSIDGIEFDNYVTDWDFESTKR